MNLMPNRIFSVKPFVHSLTVLRFVALDWRLSIFCSFSQVVCRSGDKQCSDEGADADTGFGTWC